MRSSSARFTALALASLLVAMAAAAAVARADNAPVVSTVTAVPTPSSTATPSYTFTTSSPGTIAIGGTGCSYSGTTAATQGKNTVMFDQLPNGTYECTLTVTDAAGNVSNSQPIHFVVNVPTPTTAPVVSNVSVSNITDNTAMVNWQTDADANTSVIYGVNTYYGAQSNPNPVTSTMNHSQILYGLLPGMVYHFYVQSGNAGGTGTSTDQTFTTTGTASTTTTTTSTSTPDAPLALTGVDAIQTTATAGGGFDNGWKWILHFTVPNAETSLNLKFSDFTSGNNSIPASNVRFFSADSSTASTSANAIGIGSASTYGSQTLNLTNDEDTTAAGRQVNVEVDVAVPAGTPAGSYSANFGAQSLAP